MLTELKRVMVAVDDSAGRATLIENLEADGYEPIVAVTLEHARSRLAHDLDAVIVDLNADTTNLIDMIRGGGHGADAWLPILAGTGSEDLFCPVRLLERGADDVIYEPLAVLRSACPPGGAAAPRECRAVPTGVPRGRAAG